jgi:hypothetical protein
MFTKEYVETFNGKIVVVELWSDQGCIIYGMLWTNTNGFLVSDMDEIICDGYSLALAEFNKRTYINGLKYPDIKTFSTAYQNISKELIQDINTTAEKIKLNMRMLGYAGVVAPVADKSKYPHICTQCGKDAYIGAMNNIECSNPGCKFYN